MKRTAAYLLAALLVLALIAQVAQRIYGNRPARRAPVSLAEIGDSLPNVEVLAVRGGSAAPLRRSIRAQSCAVIYFFDPDCGACRESAPTWSHANGVPSGIAVRPNWVGVTADLSASEGFLEEHELLDDPAYTTATAFPSDLGIAGVPTVWIIKNGVVEQIFEGALTTSAEFIRSKLEPCAL